MSKTTGGAIAICGTVVAAGAIAALPLFGSAMGVLGLVWLLEGKWDATWNDGDLNLALVAFLILLVILAGAGGLGRFWAGVAGFHRTKTMWLTVSCALVLAVILDLLIAHGDFRPS